MDPKVVKKCGCTELRYCGMHRGAAWHRQFHKHGHGVSSQFDKGWDRPVKKVDKEAR